MQNSYALHHFHRRKRAGRRLEPYPHPNRWKRLLDRAIYVVIFVGLGLTVPQVANVWIDRNASGVSAITWGTYVFTSSFWLIYGIVHKDRPIVFSSIAWVTMNALVAAGAVIYG